MSTAAVSLILVTVVFAQETLDVFPGPPSAVKKFRIVRVLEIKEALELDEDTALKLNDIFIKFDGEREDSAKELQKDLKSLRDSMFSGKADDWDLARLLDRISDGREHMFKIMKREVKEIRQLLSPVQQSRLVLLMEIHGKHPGPAGYPPPPDGH